MNTLSTFVKRSWLPMGLSIFLTICCLFPQAGTAQRDFYNNYKFEKADTLRGALRPERSCYDVTFYDLHLRVDERKKYLSGFVGIEYKALADFERLQIDLFENMVVEKIVFGDRELTYERVEDAVFVDFPKQEAGSSSRFDVYYAGFPVVARNAPWDGGFVWSEDDKGRPWIGVACEGDGASLWWPNKDHLSDEPDSLSIRVAVRDPLQCIANGNLRGTYQEEKGFTTYHWFVSYPINNYNVTVNIGHYAHFSDVYTAGDGSELDLDYYVLSYNLEKAKKHFEQVHPTLSCFERFFGKYPFWKDGFALVETPYLGMEHQSAIAYGNKYMRGYLGGMIPRDMDWDYIIVHETGHEYFGNSLSCNDLSEMWIHESFTTYMEALFVECQYSYEDAVRYLGGQRMYIGNFEPIIGPKDVNWEDWKFSDHYYKGSWILHTLRHAINDHEQWFALLKGFYEEHAISNVTTEDFIEYVNTFTGKDYTAFFEQYLWHKSVPQLIYSLKEVGDDLEVQYRWEAEVETFDMPVLVGRKGDYIQVQPNTKAFQTVLIPGMAAKEFRVAKELQYVRGKKW
jgi:aminopeptidase N